MPGAVLSIKGNPVRAAVTEEEAQIGLDRVRVACLVIEQMFPNATRVGHFRDNIRNYVVTYDGVPSFDSVQFAGALRSAVGVRCRVEVATSTESGDGLLVRVVIPKAVRFGLCERYSTVQILLMLLFLSVAVASFVAPKTIRDLF